MRLDRRTLRILWGIVALVVVALLAVGAIGTKAATPEERAQRLEREIKCPTCSGQSVAQSEAPAALGVKTVIRDQIAAGRSDEQIRDYIAAKYNKDLLLDPAGSGFPALVWAVPVIVVVVAVGGLVYRFRDWRPGGIAPTDEDRDLVAAALTDDAAPADAP
jgi:cytochrome c-type biogenesis protein CcmH